jgi:hypothetical protein
MVDVMSGKTYKTKIKQNYDVKGGYFYYIELPDELIQELGWNEDLKLDVVVKLGEKNNVMLITRA